MSTTPEVRPLEQVDFEQPEPVTIHKTYPNPVDAAAWGVLPGTGLCGFVFTTANHVGSGAAVEGDPRFIVKHCAPCEDVAQQHLLMWLDDDLWARG